MSTCQLYCLVCFSISFSSRCLLSEDSEKKKKNLCAKCNQRITFFFYFTKILVIIQWKKTIVLSVSLIETVKMSTLNCIIFRIQDHIISNNNNDNELL
jgi:hypothetical protein